jgi:predicted homoserine dehydrogenase-like protein
VTRPHPTHAIGIAGTGFIARGFARLVLRSHPDLRIAAVLTRRDPATVEFPGALRLTHSIDELVERCKLIVECSGDPIHATEVVSRALAAGRQVVTMNSEFHVTTGSYFASQGLLTEAEGDQPGCLAALHEEALAMGFKPVAYVNMKGYQNHAPTEADMRYWAERQNFSVQQTTSFTDGTKLQIEQAFIANGMGATLIRRGMIGSTDADVKAVARSLGLAADGLRQPVADYVLHGSHAPGVFLVARHDAAEQVPLRTIKMGDGPYYVLMRNYHLCALEIAKTVRRVLAGGPPLLTNSTAPTVGVAAVAKRDIPAGTLLPYAIGSFDLRGEAVLNDEAPSHVPIGLIQNARVRHSLQAGQTVSFGDVELPDSLALRIATSREAPSHLPAAEEALHVLDAIAARSAAPAAAGVPAVPAAPALQGQVAPGR